MIVKKAMAIVGMLYRLTDLHDPTALRTVFFGCILPILEYCSPVWSTACPTTLNLLNRPVNFFLSVARHRIPTLRFYSRDAILSSLRISNITSRRVLLDLMFLHRIFSGSLRSNEILPLFRFHVPPRPLRNNSLLHIPRFRLSISQRSLFYRIPSLFNSMASKIPSLDLFSSSTMYKSSLKRHQNNSPLSRP